jgi:hypothetical protein
MPADPLKGLATELRAKPPKGLAQLSAEQLADLTSAVRDARHQQTADLAAAGDQAFAHIPRLLRGPIRKVIG